MANEGMHKPNDFTPVIGALDLADYVIKITDNFNKFPDFTEKQRKNPDGTVTSFYIQRQDSLVNWVREQAKEIFVLTYSANRINLTRQPWRKEERLRKQERAVDLCVEHLAGIQLCRKHFHLTNSKVKYWGGKTVILMNAIDNWNTSDRDRYKNI